MTSLSALIKGALLFLLALLMLLLVFLALFSLSQVDDGTAPPSVDTEAGPLEPITSVPLGPEGTGSVTCARSEDEESGYALQVVNPGDEPEDILVAIDLVEAEGFRSSRTVSVTAAPPGETVAVAVPDSADTNRFTGCTITAVQQGKQVTLTGR